MALLAFALQTSAQAYVRVTTTETLVNTDTAYLSLPTMSGGYYAVGIQISLTNSNGAAFTPTGTAVVQGKMNDSDWVQISTVSFAFASNGRWTTTPSTIAPCVYQNIRVRFVTSGTVAATPVVFYRLIKLLTAANGPTKQLPSAYKIYSAVLPDKIVLRTEFVTQSLT